MRSFRLAACFAALLCSTLTPTLAVAQAAGQPTYYDLDDDPDALMLFGLDSIAGTGANTTFIIVNVYRPQPKTGNIMTWHINCLRGTMNIIKGMQFDARSSGKPSSVKGKIVSTQSSALSREISELACTGAGNLLQEKTYHAELPDIIKEFWR